MNVLTKENNNMPPRMHLNKTMSNAIFIPIAGEILMDEHGRVKVGDQKRQIMELTPKEMKQLQVVSIHILPVFIPRQKATILMQAVREPLLPVLHRRLLVNIMQKILMHYLLLVMEKTIHLGPIL